MNLQDLSQHVAARIPDLFSCSHAPRGGIRVETPMLYPDGGVVDVFIIERRGVWFVTDFGEGLGWLEMKANTEKRSPRQVRMIQDICQTLGVTNRDGYLESRLKVLDEVGEAVVRVAQAVVQVADVSFTLGRTHSERRLTLRERMNEEVGKWLTSREIRHKREFRISGSSGQPWIIDYRTSVNWRTSLVSLVSAGSRSAAGRQTEHVVTLWSDLVHLDGNGSEVAKISLFDDTRDVWRQEHFRLAERMSKVALWSRRQQFENMIRHT